MSYHVFEEPTERVSEEPGRLARRHYNMNKLFECEYHHVGSR
jgi:hypothetical protein